MCHASKGDLPLTIRWLFKDKPIFTHLGVMTTKMGERSNFLTVPSVQAENIGVYTCVALNAAGSYNYSAELNVHGICFLVILNVLLLLFFNLSSTSYCSIYLW